MKKLCLALLGLLLLAAAWGQTMDEMLWQDVPDSLYTDIVKVNFEKKSPQLAMLLSGVLPGAGQFYAKKSAFTTFLFPVLEAAMIGGMIYFDAQGDKKTDTYESYATDEVISHTFNYTVNGIDYTYNYSGPRYRREYQNQVQTVLMDINALDVYDVSFFRLDEANSQHFYEDIGKYDKYIFGWADWYHTFAADPRTQDGNFILDDPAFADVWIFDNETWDKNRSIEDLLNGVFTNHIDPGSAAASPFRAEYIRLRNESKKEYAKARYFTFGLAANHLAAIVDAALLINRVNRTAITQNSLKLYYCADVFNDRLTPRVGLSYSF